MTYLVGALLCAGVPTSAAATQASKSASSRVWQTHIVQPGESLGIIAARYRVRVAHLVEWNKIEDPDKITAGLSLRVFAPKVAGQAPPRPQGSAPTKTAPAGPGKSAGQRPASDGESTSKPSGTGPDKSGSKSADPEPARATKKRSMPSASGPKSSDASPAPELATKQGARSLPSLSDPSAWNPKSKPRANHPGTSQLRLHTIPTRPRSFSERTFIFAVSEHRGAFDADKKRSWWQRRKDRRKARRARRFAAKRERALAEQRGEQGSARYEPRPSPASKSTKSTRGQLGSRTPNPAPPGKAQSVGLPNKGKLVRGIQLKSTNWYTVRTPEETWGSSNTINVLHHALVRFRENSNYKRELIVQDISIKGGGKFAPHKSHQSGRDVDIRLPVNRHVARNGVPRKVSQVDWNAAWALVHELIKSGEVEYIFLNYDRQKHLYRAAKRAGVSKKLLAKWIQYPTHSKSKRAGLVRHVKGHSVHIHVRFHCGKQERRCRSK